ncbi:unnamed protein product [Rodentolepis nana]|uniref:DUF5727 domain-containing protein n=1 Tax=Rodentolepis nana TaxID=102285 RepID=A0A0R3TVW7_RODNA|nr:unnamed protein product [Rodentolepis nana]
MLDAESQEAYGSRIVTTSRGPVGPLKFSMLDVPVRLSTATLSFDDVSQYKYIEVTDGTYEYNVFFTDHCQFPTPKPGDVVIPPLIPLYRYLKDEKSVDIEFKIYNPPNSKPV